MDLSMSVNCSHLLHHSISMDLENFVILDYGSGTYFLAKNMVLINWSTLTEEQKEIMFEGSDAERRSLAQEVAVPHVIVETTTEYKE